MIGYKKKKQQMNRDILAHWKTNRFVLADFELLGSPDLLVVLTDIKFWTKHADELLDWCDLYGARLAGMTVEFNTKEQLTMFYLRWS